MFHCPLSIESKLRNPTDKLNRINHPLDSWSQQRAQRDTKCNFQRHFSASLRGHPTGMIKQTLIHTIIHSRYSLVLGKCRQNAKFKVVTAQQQEQDLPAAPSRESQFPRLGTHAVSYSLVSLPGNDLFTIHLLSMAGK